MVQAGGPQGAAGLPPGDVVAAIHKLTNLNDVNRLLHEVLQKERQVDGELDRLLGKRAELERNFLLLNAPTTEVRGSATGSGPWNLKWSVSAGPPACASCFPPSDAGAHPC